MSKILDLVRNSQLKDGLPVMNPGDTVRVHARIVEGNKERVQVFEGTVIKVRNASVDASVTVRRISHQIGVERTFLLHSPRIEKFEVMRRGDVRRAALYYLRDRTGKSARIKEKRLPTQQPTQQASQRPTQQETTQG
jgi:large subunit ribosomal protein L19